MEWRRLGGTVPKEFTTDMSLALLNAYRKYAKTIDSILTHDPTKETVEEVKENESADVLDASFDLENFYRDNDPTYNKNAKNSGKNPVKPVNILNK